MNTEMFTAEINQRFDTAVQLGCKYIDINAGDLHRIIGNYPDARLHRMPMCCQAMYKLKRASDEIVSAPPKGKGASLTIRYLLPRR